MEKRYKPKYFQVHELLPPRLYTFEMYSNEDARDMGYLYMDEKLLITIDVIREIIGKPLICNTWYMDGNRQYSGFREQNCPVGSSTSQHKLGKAVDLVCHYYTAEEMRQMIEKNKHLLPYPIRIESDVAWLHLDCKEMDYKGKKIYYFKG